MMKYFVLIYLYNSNAEVEQVKTICELNQMLGEFSLNSYEKVIFVDFFKSIF